MRLVKRVRKKNRLDITPLIDVVFLLLIFFMLTFSLPEQGFNLNLPEKGARTSKPQVPLTLKVHHDGSLTMNNKIVGYDSLMLELQRAMVKGNDRALSVDVHKNVGYDVFVRVLDLSKRAGVESFSIIH